MKRMIPIVFILLLLPLAAAAQNESIVIIGDTQSFVHGTPGVDKDILIYKVDGHGNKLWRKNYGGAYDDDSWERVLTSDGGFLIIGETQSFVHGTPGVDKDGLVYKLDADGNKQWRKNLGGTEEDKLYTGFETRDGGYIVTGDTKSYTHGSNDVLVYKLNAAGNKLWRKNLGGAYYDGGAAAIECSDGNYLILGDTDSYVNGTPGADTDLLVYKLDPSGNKLWRKNYGGVFFEGAIWMYEDAAGDYLISGMTSSFVNGTPGTDYDVLVYKIDASGNKLWRKNYGGAEQEFGFLYPDAGGNHYVRANTQSYVHGTPGTDSDFLVYRIDSSGNKLWRKNLGGAYPEGSAAVYETPDGGYLVSGRTKSFVNGDPGSDADMLIYKLNASLSKRWRKNYGGMYEERVGRLRFLSNGDLLLIGQTRTYVNGTPGDDWDMLLYRLDESGSKRWRKNYGGIYAETLSDVFVIE